MKKVLKLFLCMLLSLTLILAFTDAAYVPHIKVTTVVEE